MSDLYSECRQCEQTGRMRYQSPTCEHCGQVFCSVVSASELSDERLPTWAELNKEVERLQQRLADAEALLREAVEAGGIFPIGWVKRAKGACGE